MNYSYLWNCGKFLSLLLKNDIMELLDKDKLVKWLKGQSRLGLTGMPKSIKVKSKWRCGRKILKFSKHENHFTPEGKLWPSMSISCLYDLAHIVSWFQFLFPSLLSKAFEASQLKCLFIGRVPEISPHLHSAPKDSTAPSCFHENVFRVTTILCL